MASHNAIMPKTITKTQSSAYNLIPPPELVYETDEYETGGYGRMGN